jgi:hypothetical protein
MNERGIFKEVQKLNYAIYYDFIKELDRPSNDVEAEVNKKIRLDLKKFKLRK